MTASPEALPLGGMFDALTGLPNRQLLRQRLDEAIRHTHPEERITALLIVSIDHFRHVNASVGYDSADQLLQSVAERLRGCLRSSDSLTRHSDDEFAVVLENLSNARDAAAVADKIAHTISPPFAIDGDYLSVTCSIGISLFPQDCNSAKALLRYASMALERARELGRNNTQFFSPELDRRAQDRMLLEPALRVAIENKQLSRCYEPLVSLQSGQVVGIEVLSRWVHPELGEVERMRFMTVAGECGLLEQIGTWLLRTACADMHDWDARGLPALPIAFNLSARQFRDPLLADKISAILNEAGIGAQRLILEIPENALMQDPLASESTLMCLQTLGVDLVLDDFGSGFSSLNYLKRFPFKKLKIGRSFVANVVSSSNDGAIVKAVISMAHSLGIGVAADGVDNEQQCDYLRLHMCDEIQGKLFSDPVDAGTMAGLLAEQRCLPERLLRLNRPPRTLLLVDDEANIISSLKRLLRAAGYRILTAAGGQEGLDILADNDIDVIVSDQRMPGMTGVEFLGKAKEIRPDTVRMVLSGYTELQSVTSAVNEGAIYKFLMKPWDDAQLREHIDEAFRRKEMADENRRLALEVSTANFELAAANRRLEEVLKQQQLQISRDEVSLDVVREILQQVPVPVIGLDEDDFIVFTNNAARDLLGKTGVMLGADARNVAPDILNDGEWQFDGNTYLVTSHAMGQRSDSRGKLITLTQRGSP